MKLPSSEQLDTNYISSVFNSTTTTYKFFWFITLLDNFVKEGKNRVEIWDLVIGIISNAWYPITYYRLSFGKSDSLHRAIWQLQDQYKIPINIQKTDLEYELKKLCNLPEVRKTLVFLTTYVPYRFLSPWINTPNNQELKSRTYYYENNCLYRILTKDHKLYIELNPEWHDYLIKNYSVLLDFSYWNLLLFLQIRNPNVPNISSKLIKIENRSPLKKQREYWDTIIDKYPSIKCIYTNNILSINNYDIDHFIPWSFVSHNLLWNLIPADSNINSSKSNKLPKLTQFLPGLVSLHQLAISEHLKASSYCKVLEDYYALGSTPQELADMDYDTIYDCFYKILSPIYQIAENMGFEQWRKFIL